MGNARAYLRKERALVRREEGAVRHDRVLAEKAKVAQRVGILLAKARQNRVVLPLSLVAVALNVGVVLRGKVSQAAKNFIGAAGDEAWRDYGPDALGRVRSHCLNLANELGGLLDGLSG